MPRGDGRKPGERRPAIKKTHSLVNTKLPKNLVARLKWWKEEKLQPMDEKRKHDGNGNTYHRPGSWKK